MKTSESGSVGIQEKKSKLRAEAISLRNALSDQAFSKISLSIRERLSKVTEIKQSDTIHCFYPISQKREIDLLQLYHQWLKEGKTLVFPKILGKDLLHIPIKSLNDFKEGKWGILEPEGEPISIIKSIDLVLVPMLAGDDYRNRLGYGKGFYDRFLAQIPDTLTIGLVMQKCIFENIPIEPTDFPLNYIVTDERIIR